MGGVQVMKVEEEKGEGVHRNSQQLQQSLLFTTYTVNILVVTGVFLKIMWSRNVALVFCLLGGVTAIGENAVSIP